MFRATLKNKYNKKNRSKNGGKLAHTKSESKFTG
jgi:hypothetical protein